MGRQVSAGWSSSGASALIWSGVFVVARKKVGVCERQLYLYSTFFFIHKADSKVLNMETNKILDKSKKTRQSKKKLVIK